VLTDTEREALDRVREDTGAIRDQDLINLAQRAVAKLQVTADDLLQAAPPQHKVAIEELHQENARLAQDRNLIEYSHGLINYGYWLTRCEAEKTPAANAAKKHLYLARQYHDVYADYVRARAEYDKAWVEWAKVLAEFPELTENSIDAQLLVEAIARYEAMLTELDEKFRLEDFPLAKFLERYRAEEAARAAGVSPFDEGF
jgi:hypothetical protein